MNHSITAVLICALLSVRSLPARAAPPEAPVSEIAPAANEPAADLNALRIGAQLAVFANQAHQIRQFLLLTGLGTAVALLPAGIVLTGRHNALQHQVGIGMVVGGAAPLAFTPLWLRPSNMERLAREFEAAQSAGEDSRALVARTERAWQHEAESAHVRRKISGWTNLVLGLASTGLGAGFLLAGHVGHMSHNNQYTVGSSLLGPGVPLATGGARSLIMASVEESSWAAYRAGQLRPTAANRRAPLGFAALPHGALATGGFAF